MRMHGGGKRRETRVRFIHIAFSSLSLGMSSVYNKKQKPFFFFTFKFISNICLCWEIIV